MMSSVQGQSCLTVHTILYNTDTALSWCQPFTITLANPSVLTSVVASAVLKLIIFLCAPQKHNPDYSTCHNLLLCMYLNTIWLLILLPPSRNVLKGKSIWFRFIYLSSCEIQFFMYWCNEHCKNLELTHIKGYSTHYKHTNTFSLLITWTTKPVKTVYISTSIMSTGALKWICLSWIEVLAIFNQKTDLV